MFALRPYHYNNLSNSYNPFRQMDELERRFFGDSSDFFGSSPLAEFKTDISDEGDAYLLEADLPGFSKEDIHLELNGDVLTLHAERHTKSEDKDSQNHMIRCERSYGRYSRAFDVSGVNTQDIRAKYEDGVLKLHLPKKQESMPVSHTLEIE